MSNSVKATLKMAAAFVLCLALGLALMWGVVGCGDEDSTSATTVQTDATGADGTDSTAGGDGDGADGDSTDAADAGDLVGKWYSDELEETLEFSDEGTMTWTEDGGEPLTFDYKVEAGVIVFTQPNAPTDNNLPFSIEGDTLTTEDIKYGTVTYTKQ